MYQELLELILGMLSGVIITGTAFGVISAFFIIYPRVYEVVIRWMIDRESSKYKSTWE